MRLTRSPNALASSPLVPCQAEAGEGRAVGHERVNSPWLLVAVNSLRDKNVRDPRLVHLPQGTTATSNQTLTSALSAFRSCRKRCCPSLFPPKNSTTCTSRRRKGCGPATTKRKTLAKTRDFSQRSPWGLQWMAIKYQQQKRCIIVIYQSQENTRTKPFQSFNALTCGM